MSNSKLCLFNWVLKKFVKCIKKINLISKKLVVKFYEFNDLESFAIVDIWDFF